MSTSDFVALDRQRCQFSKVDSDERLCDHAVWAITSDQLREGHRSGREIEPIDYNADDRTGRGISVRGSRARRTPKRRTKRRSFGSKEAAVNFSRHLAGLVIAPRKNFSPGSGSEATEPSRGDPRSNLQAATSKSVPRYAHPRITWLTSMRSTKLARMRPRTLVRRATPLHRLPLHPPPGAGCRSRIRTGPGRSGRRL
jgi:hypothetical protein